MNSRGSFRATLMAAVAALSPCGEARAQTAPLPLPDLGTPLANLPLATLSATRERPLFSPTRRPASAPSGVAPVAPQAHPIVVVYKPDSPPLTLLGTIIGPHGRIAIFMDEATKEAMRLREGDEASGWMLVSVGRRSAALRNDRRVLTLELPNTTAVGDVSDTVRNTATAEIGLARDLAAERRRRWLSAARKARPAVQ